MGGGQRRIEILAPARRELTNGQGPEMGSAASADGVVLGAHIRIETSSGPGAVGCTDSFDLLRVVVWRTAFRCGYLAALTALGQGDLKHELRPRSLTASRLPASRLRSGGFAPYRVGIPPLTRRRAEKREGADLDPSSFLSGPQFWLEV